MNQFCCGCSLSVGAWIIIGANLVQNLFTIATATSNVILKIPTFGFTASLMTQTLNASFCLLGLPFIFGAMWGLIHKLEPNMRLYLVYITASFILDGLYLVAFLLLQDMCGQGMPEALQ